MFLDPLLEEDDSVVSLRDLLVAFLDLPLEEDDSVVWLLQLTVCFSRSGTDSLRHGALTRFGSQACEGGRNVGVADPTLTVHHAGIVVS